jgi:hypothetical protein
VRGISAAASATIITQNSFSAVGVTDTDIWTTTLDLVRPALVAMTGFIGQFSGTSVAVSDYVASFGGRHNQAVAYDGISFIPQAGTITGVMRIYGMRNS